MKSIKVTVMSDEQKKKKVVSFNGKINVVSQNWQTVMTKKVASFLRKNRDDTLSCRPG